MLRYSPCTHFSIFALTIQRKGFPLSKFSRRDVLKTSAIFGAVLAGSAVTGVWPSVASTRPRNPFLKIPFDPEETRTIGIVGAGIAGLTAAYVAAKSGFRVIVLESDSRYGGRSLTVRPKDAAYREWWFNKYNPERLFPRMYVDEYQERLDSPASAPQIANMSVEYWSGTDEPVELYLNAGPGRIPSDHADVIDLCQAIDVRLEPYIFLSESNLLSSETHNDNQPVQWRQVNYSLMGELASVLSSAMNDGLVLQGYEETSVKEMLTRFGKLQADGSYEGSASLGYIRLPGGWRTPYQQETPISLTEILESGFVAAGNPPASSLFNSDNIFWQPTLMQPVGGMDRIWQRLLLQEIPAQALDYVDFSEVAPNFTGRDLGELSGKRFIGDLVHLGHSVKSIDNVDNGVRLGIDGLATPLTVDFCIATVAPAFIGGASSAPVDGTADYKVPIPEDSKIMSNLSPRLKKALADVEIAPAVKVGFQGRYRFWEEEDEIYGGISWTDAPATQVWYPSDDFNAPTGILTGAYVGGEAAYVYGLWSQQKRILKALKSGETLHQAYSEKVYADDALTIAWHYMPGQISGWASETYMNQANVYKRITKLPRGAVYFAGDNYSQWPGWQEGAVSSAKLAVQSIQTGLTSTDPQLYEP